MIAADFDRQVMHRLTRQARRLRAGRMLIGAGTAALVALGALAGQFLLDWSLRLPKDMRAALLAAVIAVAAWALWRMVVAPQRLRFGAREMACAVERRFPQLDALLISAVDFRTGRVGSAASNSPQLVESVIAQAAEAADRVPFEEIIDPRAARRGAGKLLGVLAVAVGAFGLAPQTMGIWLDRNLLLRDVEWPKRTRLVVDLPPDGVVRGALGDDLEIRAHVETGYDVPRQVDISYETRAGKVGRETMTGVGERGLRIVFPRVREEFRFRLTGGDDATPWYETKLSERPHIESATLTVAAPAYTRLGTITLPEGQRAAEVYPGSTLTIRALCSKPVAQARLLAGAEQAAPAKIDGTQLAAVVAPQDSRTYHFELVDDDGLADNRPVRFSARLLEDQPPKVRLQLVNVGNMVTPEAVLPVEAEFSDQLGLAEAALVYQVSAEGATPQTLALAGFAPTDTLFRSRHDWPVAATGAKVGEQVSVFAQGRDFNDVSGPGVGASTTVTFRVVTADELLAEFSRREQEYRRQFERLVDSQERLRGDLLTLLGRMDDSAVADSLDVELAPLERRQRQIAAQVNVVRQQFEQVLAEMAVNRLDSTDVRLRVGGGIVEPLTELGTRELADAADQLRRLGRERTIEMARTVDPVQAEVLARMRAVLENMLKWEGLQETVTMLREIVRLQQELNAETRREIERQGGDLFDD